VRCFRRLDETRRSLLWRRLEPIRLSLHVGQLRSYAPRRRDPGWFAPWNQLASVLPTKSWMAPPFGAKPGTSTRPPVQPPQSRHSGSLLQQRANCRLGALIEESRPAGRARPGHQPCQLAKRCSGTHGHRLSEIGSPAAKRSNRAICAHSSPLVTRDRVRMAAPFTTFTRLIHRCRICGSRR
jgi:hypothetical protein